jgi:16S rRNA C967 or C1407 C5-methylase (RsmB/RsmF family)
MSNEQQNKKIGEILAKCWADESFKKRLLADANTTLKAEGVEVPAGVTVNVLENTDKVINYVLPNKPKAELSDADLDKVAGGGMVCNHDCGKFNG